MKKRFLSFLLAGAMGTGLLAGTTVNAEEAPKHIIVTWVHYAGEAPDMEAVTDAVNAITVPEINVEVEFMPISIGDTYTKYGTFIASGEEIDCMLLLFQNPLQYFNNGSIEPLNDLMAEYGTTISSLAEDFPILASVDSEIYGFAPVDQYYGTQNCVYLAGAYADAVTDLVSSDSDHVYSLDELTEIFAAVKEKYPDVYPFNPVGSSVTASQLPSVFTAGNIYDLCGGDFASGALMGTDGTEVVNYFATEEYYNYLKTVRSWYEAGYILPDAATTDSTDTDLVKSGVTGTALTGFNPIVYADEVGNLGENVIPLKTTAPYYASTAAGMVTWTIPTTAAEPEAAMQFYDLIYRNVDLANLIMWGIEGQHYVKTETEQVIAFPDGVSPENSGYYNTFGVWGDRRDQYVWNEMATKEPNTKFTNEALANPTRAGLENFRYDSTYMTSQIANIDTVITQYAPALECGSVADLDTVYQEFLGALEKAGINEVIADKQAQFDAYYADVK